MNDIFQRILIAEDDPLIAQLYQTAFTAKGFIVQLAFNGEEVMAHLNNSAEERPDILLLDLLMPKLNGYEVLKQIKQNPELKTIPIVVLSNLSEWHDAEQALELGASLYMVKSSYAPNEIVMKVREILTGKINNNDSGSGIQISTKDIPASNNDPRASEKNQ